MNCVNDIGFIPEVVDRKDVAVAGPVAAIASGWAASVDCGVGEALRLHSPADDLGRPVLECGNR
jgi:hypothetical protein